jgi:hypothetical protein
MKRWADSMDAAQDRRLLKRQAFLKRLRNGSDRHGKTVPTRRTRDLRPRRTAGEGPTTRLLCYAQHSLSRLDALVGAAPDPIR